MTRFEILNSKEKKKITALINERFDSKFKTEKAIIKVNNKLFLINRELEELNFKNLRIERFGLYFATLESKMNSTNKIRLSIEGSQIVGKTAKKNILTLNEEQVKRWLLGEDIKIGEGQMNRCTTGFVILKFKDDFFGCGLLKQVKNQSNREEGKEKRNNKKGKGKYEEEKDKPIEYEIKNYVPKERRLKSFLM